MSEFLARLASEADALADEIAEVRRPRYFEFAEFVEYHNPMPELQAKAVRLRERAHDLLGTEPNIRSETPLADGCRRLAEFCRAAADQAPPGGADSADRERLFPEGVPADSDVVDLVVLLDTEAGKPRDKRRSQNKIAREFARDDARKAETLLRTIRRLKAAGKVNL